MKPGTRKVTNTAAQTLAGILSGLIITAIYFEISERAGLYNRPYLNVVLLSSLLLGAAIAGWIQFKLGFNWMSALWAAGLLVPSLAVFILLYECGHGNCL